VFTCELDSSRATLAERGKIMQATSPLELRTIVFATLPATNIVKSTGKVKNNAYIQAQRLLMDTHLLQNINISSAFVYLALLCWTSLLTVGYGGVCCIDFNSIFY
jgi:uncharacterized membrane protein SpoIIM required for sporulation